MNIIEELNNAIEGVREATKVESPTWKEVVKHLLPTREILKNRLMSQGFTDVEAHAIVYGHTNLNSTEVNKLAIPTTSDIYKGALKMVDNVKTSVNQLYNESVRALKSLEELTAESVMTVAAIANANATVPPQPSVALMYAKNYNVRVKEVSESFKRLDTIVGPLADIAFIVLESALVTVLTPIIVLLDTIAITIESINAIPTI